MNTAETNTISLSIRAMVEFVLRADNSGNEEN